MHFFDQFLQLFGTKYSMRFFHLTDKICCARCSLLHKEWINNEVLSIALSFKKYPKIPILSLEKASVLFSGEAERAAAALG